MRSVMCKLSPIGTFSVFLIGENYGAMKYLAPSEVGL